MPWEPTGGKPGKRPYLPHKLAMTMLYGIVPGVKIVAPGVVWCSMKELTHHLRMQHNQVHECLDLLLDWGVLREVDKSSGSYVARFVEPRIWRGINEQS